MMTDPLVLEMHLHHHHDNGWEEKKTTGDVSSSSLSAVDLCASDVDWGTSAHTTRY